jgi:hypothetical protein
MSKDLGKTLTIIRANFAPLGLDIGPPVFSFDKFPVWRKHKCEITAVTV